jgi:hypothetical protein
LPDGAAGVFADVGVGKQAVVVAGGATTLQHMKGVYETGRLKSLPITSYASYSAPRGVNRACDMQRSPP